MILYNPFDLEICMTDEMNTLELQQYIQYSTELFHFDLYTLHERENTVLLNDIENKLKCHSSVSIISLDSFSKQKCTNSQEVNYDVIIGIDRNPCGIHHSRELILYIRNYFMDRGFTLGYKQIDFKKLIPMKYYDANDSIKGLKVEFCDSLYLNSKYQKNTFYSKLKHMIEVLIFDIQNKQHFIGIYPNRYRMPLNMSRHILLPCPHYAYIEKIYADRNGKVLCLSANPRVLI